MRLSAILSLYVGKRFLYNLGILMLVILGLVFLLDTVELMRRAANNPSLDQSTLIQMALFKLPHLGQQVFPFIVLFAGMLTFWQLTRSSELMVTRATGVSAWQFLTPVMATTLVLGAILVGGVNPASSVLLARYELLEARLFKGQDSALAISASGIWLRQSGDFGQTVIFGRSASQTAEELRINRVSVFNYEGTDVFRERLEADRAVLEEGYWWLSNVWRYRSTGAPTHLANYRLRTDLTLASIQDSFSPPETMSFWALPGFINTLEESGFSALRHRLYWHALVATPFLLCAMVLLAATFTIRHSRKGGAIPVIAGGVGAGFVLYFFSDVVFALGISDSIPVVLAAWAPSGIATLMGLAMLLHLEDG